MVNAEKSILIIEDEKDLADLFYSMFKEKGYNVNIAYDGEEALNALNMCKPDAILLDLILPKMSGFEVLKSIRSASSTYFTPVIIVTNLSGKENVDKGMTMGANEYLIKSHIRLQDILERIESIIKYNKRKE